MKKPPDQLPMPTAAAFNNPGPFSPVKPAAPPEIHDDNALKIPLPPKAKSSQPVQSRTGTIRCTFPWSRGFPGENYLCIAIAI